MLILLGIVFLVLKLTQVIDWSWFWVVLPFLIHFTSWIITIILYLISVAMESRW